MATIPYFSHVTARPQCLALTDVTGENLPEVAHLSGNGYAKVSEFAGPKP